MRALLRWLTPILLIALGGFAIAQAEATPFPPVSVLPAPAQDVAAVPPVAASGDAPTIAVQPDADPAPPNTTGDLRDPLGPLLRAAYNTDTPGDAPPASEAVRPTTTSADRTDPPATASRTTIEGYDLFEVFLRITGILTTTPTTVGDAPADILVETPAPTDTPAALTTPKPVQPPPPAVLTTPKQTQPPPPAAVTAPTVTPATSVSPGAQTTPRTGPLQPSVFEQAQIVSFYGYPGVATMGELGLHTPSGAAAAITRLAAEYDALNGPREVMPALHLIVAVAQRHPGNSGLYLGRMSNERLSEYVEAARAAGILLFVDVQIGWSDALTEVRLLEDVLREPFVHLAIDPEFATRSKGTAPGVAIGTLDAADVNAVQHYLAGLVREHDLPPKVLVLHQFLQSMLTRVDQYDDVAEVDVTIDMDGFGNPYVKLAKYDLYAAADYAERAAIKLFYHWDAPLMTPGRLLSLDNPPDLVIYQ